MTTMTLPVDTYPHGGEDPDPAEHHMPRWAPFLDLPARRHTMTTAPGDELVAAINPFLDVVVDESNCIVLRAGADKQRVTISNVGDLAQALLEARLVVEAREQGYDRRHPCGHPLCIGCNEPAGVPHAEGTIGSRTGPLCKDCAHYCDGNVVTTIELGPEAIAKFQFAKVIADASVLVDDLASCGHPRNADGECDCSTWPEPNPHAHDGHISCTPEGCVVR